MWTSPPPASKEQKKNQCISLLVFINSDSFFFWYIRIEKITAWGKSDSTFKWQPAQLWLWNCLQTQAKKTLSFNWNNPWIVFQTISAWFGLKHTILESLIRLPIANHSVMAAVMNIKERCSATVDGNSDSFLCSSLNSNWVMQHKAKRFLYSFIFI